MSLSFFVPGVPRGRAHTRGFYNKALGRVMNVPQQSGEQVGWFVAVREAGALALQSGSWEKVESGALSVRLDFIVPRPGQFYWKTAHAEPRCYRGIDVDNLAKAFLDCLNGVLFRDDAQIAHLAVGKRYSRPGECCGCQAELRELGAWYPEMVPPP